MRVLGIICEYNPLHNGHAYQMRQGMERSGADAVVCVMSGHYTQRGEPAITDKWTRARMALSAGADLVIEIPTLYAMSGAESFARAGVKLLLEAGADILSFGCEAGEEPELRALADLFHREPEEYRRNLRAGLDAGESYSVSRMKAAEAYVPGAEEILRQSGSILGIEYLKALVRAGRADFPTVMVKRRGAGHRDEESLGPYASASGIRKAFRQGKMLDEAMPAEVAGIWKEAVAEGNYSARGDLWKEMLYWRLTELGPHRLSKIPEVGEGLEYRILKAAEEDLTWDELVSRILSKRYPASRIRRGLMNLCLGITEESRARAHWEEGPGYLRVLAIGPRGGELLRGIRRESDLPILTRPARQLAELTEGAAYMFREETRLTDVYARFLANPKLRRRGVEYKKEIVKN